MKTLNINTPRVFLPLVAQATYKGAWGGRGSGKSHFFAELLIERCITTPGLRAVCLREVQKSLKESAKRLLEDKIQAMGVGHLFEVQADCIKTPGGGIIIFQGLQDHTSESIKSLEGFRVAWVEEAQTISERSLELLDPTIRSPGSEMWFSWNPRNATDPIDKLLRGQNPPTKSVVVKACYSDNPFFPAELEEKRAYAEKHSRERYGHIWLGDYEPAAIGAIFDRVTIAQNRREAAPELDRVVVGIDPAVSSESGSDMHGVVVAGRCTAGHGYVVHDGSLRGSPRQWAERAVALYDAYEADAIVIEVNQGGDMCRHTLQSVRPGLRVVEVRATRGKHVRAEPIAALYSLGRVHHVGTMPELEDQLCLFTASGYEGAGSPDRADALVWAMTELFPGMVRKAADPAPPVDYGAGGWMG
jgi:hypothetical protein